MHQSAIPQSVQISETVAKFCWPCACCRPQNHKELILRKQDFWLLITRWQSKSALLCCSVLSGSSNYHSVHATAASSAIFIIYSASIYISWVLMCVYPPTIIFFDATHATFFPEFINSVEQSSNFHLELWFFRKPCYYYSRDSKLLDDKKEHFSTNMDDFHCLQSDWWVCEREDLSRKEEKKLLNCPKELISMPWHNKSS